jgi:hypothetical protein
MKPSALRIERLLAAIEGKLTPPKTRTVMVWRDVYGEDKLDQTIADMRADGRLTDQDRLIICSWGLPAGGRRKPSKPATGTF